MVSAPWVPAPAPAGAAAIDRAVLSTIAYGDIFDFPLRDIEVHRYLHGVHATPEATQAALARCSAPDGALSHCDGHYTLRGREALVAARRERAARARRLWPDAVRYGRAIAGLPFVRLVGVTGSLAWENVPPAADIDYLVVTDPGHLWVCRWLIAALRRVARLEGLCISPNHMVTTRALAVPDRDLYVAYELSGMQLIAGRVMYRSLRRANAWTASFLPNAADQPLRPPIHVPRASRSRDRVLTRLAGAAEKMLRSGVGRAVERYEMRYRIRKIRHYRTRTIARGDHPPVASYGADWYKEYWGGHRPRTLAAFAERLRGLGAYQ